MLEDDVLIQSKPLRLERPALIHRFQSPFRVLGQILRGKTLIRGLFNLAIERHEANGRILDLGSKSSAGSYYKHLRIASGSERVFTDLEGAEGVIRLDVEKPFPLADESFDCVLSFHLFEHVFRFGNAPEEVFRILKSGGKLFISVPFLHEFHADADDYFRYTDSALLRIWEGAGFRCRHMEAIGEGPITACATKLPTLVWPRFGRNAVVGLCYLMTTPLDRLLRFSPKRDGKSVAQRFALEHFAVFEKP